MCIRDWAQALSIACPTVIFDFNRLAEEKLLFKYVDRFTNPISQIYDNFDVTGTSNSNRSTHIVNGDIEAGAQFINIAFTNPYWDGDVGESTLLVIHSIDVRNEAGSIVSFDGTDLASIEGFIPPRANDGNVSGANYVDDEGVETGYMMWAGSMDIPISVDLAGSYALIVDASRVSAPARDVKMLLSVNNPSSAFTLGQQSIRQELQYLHSILLGEFHEVESEEINQAYDLLTAIWQDRKDAGLQRTAFDPNSETCDIPIDEWWLQDWEDEFSDPVYMQGTWISMLIYFLTDYKYLHE